MQFQDESKLIIQKTNLVAEITECQSKIKSFEREITKNKKQINKLELTLDHLDSQIQQSKHVYQQAFVFVLNKDHGGDVMSLFRAYPTQSALVERYTNIKCVDALKIYVKYCIAHLDSWADVLNLYNVARISKELYTYVLTTHPSLPSVVQPSVVQPSVVPQSIVPLQPSVVQHYPTSKLIDELYWCYDRLSGDLQFENPIYYIKIWRHRVKVLLAYWKVPYNVIPLIPDSVPYPIQEQLTANDDEIDAHNAVFQTQMANMNTSVERCVDAVLSGACYVLPKTHDLFQIDSKTDRKTD